jgi:Kdo2-lipid IVA lauroyltransferase/acyltransferase
MKDAPILHRIEYAVYLLVRGASRLFPHPWARRLGRGLGTLAWAVDRRHRRVAEKNLEIAFPDLANREHRRLAHESFRHFGGAVCDAISATRFDLVELCRRFRFEGWEHVEAAEAAGKGYFVLGSHLGYWEFSARPIGLFRGTIHAVARPTDNPHLDRELRGIRETSGYEVIPKQGAARRMMQVLKSGGRVGILIDQRVQPREAIVVPFFGRPALTTPALARLSVRTGAPVLPVFAYAEEGGRYRFVAHPPIFPTSAASEASGASEETAVSELTTLYLAATEREIREHPAEWLWMHDRWREPKQQRAD